MSFDANKLARRAAAPVAAIALIALAGCGDSEPTPDTNPVVIPGNYIDETLGVVQAERQALEADDNVTVDYSDNGAIINFAAGSIMRSMEIEVFCMSDGSTATITDRDADSLAISRIDTACEDGVVDDADRLLEHTELPIRTSYSIGE